MEIKVDINELRKRKLFVAAPMYGGMCAGMFTRSSNDLSAAAVHYGVELRYYYLFNESLITRARNYCVDEFLRSDCTHMLFIDSDIGFNAQDIITMLALMSDDSEYDILCAPYPKKCISWEKVKIAVDKGMADENPNVLEKYVGDYVFNPVGGRTEIPLGEPVEVLESGTGFMMIKKSALQKFAEQYPEYSYRPDHVRTEAFDGSREILAYFDALIDNKHSNIRREIRAFFEKNQSATAEEVIAFIDDTRNSAIDGKTYSMRYLSEDYMFCQWARNIGLKVWLCPWIQLQHVGTYIFGGSLADLAAVGAAATVDPSKLGKKKTG
jgi:hypothetical protein